MTDDERADYQQQLEEIERHRIEERERYITSHPGYEQCPKHPERPVVDSGVCTLRHCAECVEDRSAAATEAAIRRDLDRHHTGRASGMGHTYRQVNIGTTDSPRYDQVEYP